VFLEWEGGGKTPLLQERERKVNGCHQEGVQTKNRQERNKGDKAGLEEESGVKKDGFTMKESEEVACCHFPRKRKKKKTTA